MSLQNTHTNWEILIHNIKGASDEWRRALRQVMGILVNVMLRKTFAQVVHPN